MNDAATSTDHIAAAMGDRNLSPKQFGARRTICGCLVGEERMDHTPAITGVLDTANWICDAQRQAHCGVRRGGIAPHHPVRLPAGGRDAGQATESQEAACDWLLDCRNRISHKAVRFDVITIVLRVGRRWCITLKTRFSRRIKHGHWQRPSVGLIGLKAFIVVGTGFHQSACHISASLDCQIPHCRSARTSEIGMSSQWFLAATNPMCDREYEPRFLPKRGSSHDLAIAASVLCAAGAIGHDCQDTIVLGEVNLDGSVLPIHGLLPIMLHAQNAASKSNHSLSQS